MSAWQDVSRMWQHRNPLTVEELAYLLADRLHPEGLPPDSEIPVLQVPARSRPYSQRELRQMMALRLWQTPEVSTSRQ